MKGSDPHRTAPSGAPSPLVKSSHTESQLAAMTSAGSPVATTAFIRRAPSMCVAMPLAWAQSSTAFSASSGQIAPPPRLAVCSTSSSVCGGALRRFSRNAARSVSTSNCPRAPLRPSTEAPVSAAGAPPSAATICAVSWAMISSPGRQWVRMAIWLHIVPLGRNIAAGLPSSAAMRSHSSCTVGSSPCCSSPTGARVIAASMAGEGLVCVSE